MKNMKKNLSIIIAISTVLFSALSFGDTKLDTFNQAAENASTIISQPKINSSLPVTPNNGYPQEKKLSDSSTDKQQKDIEKNFINDKVSVYGASAPEHLSSKENIELKELNERLKTYKNIPQVIKDEEYQAVEISLKDVSRIVCFTNIKRTIYSKEKGIEIKTVDRNAFIKNLPKENVDPVSGLLSLEYDSRPKEVYLVCGDKTFSLLLIPKDIPANTIYLKSSYVDKEKAFEFEKSNDYENMLLKLIKSAYYENIPEGYETENIKKVIKEYQEIQLVHNRNYRGVMFEVQEYIIIAKKDISINEITLLQAISPKNPLAVSIVSPLLRNKEQSRVFIVRLIKDE